MLIDYGMPELQKFANYNGVSNISEKKGKNGETQIKFELTYTRGTGIIKL